MCDENDSNTQANDSLLLPESTLGRRTWGTKAEERGSEL